MLSSRRLAHLLILFNLFPLATRAQTAVPVLMLSDIHFDPFHDPAKVAQLRTEPIEHWPGILSSAPSPTQAADLEALQNTCRGRALDTAWPLLQSALTAAREASPHPAFVTLSGDLLTHEFPCRFRALTRGATPGDISAFAAKTVAFVMVQLKAEFSRVPVYGALGNNDSGCADYRETPADAFLKSASETLATAGALAAAPTPEGDYTIPLPAPITHARLIVLQDIFEAHQFATCGGASDRDAEKTQIDWLRAQLADAREHHEHVWVMAHIPPGVDVYTSFRRYVLRPAAMCDADPHPFLADTSLPDALLDYADTVRLTLFGHTHMDEFRLLSRSSVTATEPEISRSPPDTAAAIPAKLVPSISPYAGNHPAFLVAYVDPRTAILKDWRTFIAPGAEGSTPPWTEAYRFTSTYHYPDFSAASATKLAGTFTTDQTGQSPESTAFRQHFYPGDFGLYALGLAQIWPAYACSVREHRPTAVHNCICKALPRPKDSTSE